MLRARYFAVFLILLSSACARNMPASVVRCEPCPTASAKQPPSRASVPAASYVPRSDEFDLWTKLAAPVVKITAPHGGGAGVIIQPDGTILTAGHVVSGGEAVKAGLSRLERDGTLTEFAWYDVDVLRINRAHDFAVLRIKRPPRNLPVAALGNSALLRAGDPVRRVGYGLVRLAVGTVMANNVPHRALARTIQIRMVGGHGASGGPIYNRDNEVVGIAVASDRSNFTPEYAIPISAIVHSIF